MNSVRISNRQSKSFAMSAFIVHPSVTFFKCDPLKIPWGRRILSPICLPSMKADWLGRIKSFRKVWTLFTAWYCIGNRFYFYFYRSIGNLFMPTFNCAEKYMSWLWFQNLDQKGLSTIVASGFMLSLMEMVMSLVCPPLDEGGGTICVTIQMNKNLE